VHENESTGRKLWLLVETWLTDLVCSEGAEARVVQQSTAADVERE